MAAAVQRACTCAWRAAIVLLGQFGGARVGVEAAAYRLLHGGNRVFDPAAGRQAADLAQHSQAALLDQLRFAPAGNQVARREQKRPNAAAVAARRSNPWSTGRSKKTGWLRQ
jgi:hypothetical protein